MVFNDFFVSKLFRSSPFDQICFCKKNHTKLFGAVFSANAESERGPKEAEKTRFYVTKKKKKKGVAVKWRLNRLTIRNLDPINSSTTCWFGPNLCREIEKSRRPKPTSSDWRTAWFLYATLKCEAKPNFIFEHERIPILRMSLCQLWSILARISIFLIREWLRKLHEPS